MVQGSSERSLDVFSNSVVLLAALLHKPIRRDDNPFLLAAWVHNTPLKSYLHRLMKLGMCLVRGACVDSRTVLRRIVGALRRGAETAEAGLCELNGQPVQNHTFGARMSEHSLQQ